MGKEDMEDTGLERFSQQAHKDRRILTEANEANEGLLTLSQTQAENPFVTFVAFRKYPMSW
jgi:hypothetical protein